MQAFYQASTSSANVESLITTPCFSQAALEAAYDAALRRCELYGGNVLPRKNYLIPANQLL